MKYLAYGSNLCVARLLCRTPSARLVGPARLDGYALRWHKRSLDGSGKCNAQRTARAGDVVRGAVFELPAAEKALLDRVEGLGVGYQVSLVEVETSRGAERVWTYVAMPGYVDDALKPFLWYRDIVIAGARALGLERGYVEAMTRVDAVKDPDSERARSNLAHLPCRST